MERDVFTYERGGLESPETALYWVWGIAIALLFIGLKAIF